MCSINNKAQTESPYVAYMDTRHDSGLLSVSVLFENNSPQTVYFTYRFNCVRVSTAGRSANNQSGSFVAASGQTVHLSETSFSIKPSDSMSPEQLEIYDGKQLIASRTLSVPQL